MKKASCQASGVSTSGSSLAGSDERTRTLRPSSSPSGVAAAKPPGTRLWSVMWLARSVPPPFISKFR